MAAIGEIIHGMVSVNGQVILTVQDWFHGVLV